MFLCNPSPPEAHAPRDAEFSADPLGGFFLIRLSRLLSLRRKASDRVNAPGARLLDQAIYSTYRDLRSLHREREAHALLVEYRERGAA